MKAAESYLIFCLKFLTNDHKNLSYGRFTQNATFLFLVEGESRFGVKILKIEINHGIFCKVKHHLLI